MFFSSLLVYGDYGHLPFRKNDVCFHVFLQYLKLMKFSFYVEMMKTYYPKAVEGVEWKKDDETFKFLCLFKDCAKRPFINRNHLAQHLRCNHMKTLPTLELSRKSNSTSKKQNINSRHINARVLTKPFKRQRKEVLKKMRAWKAKREDLWKAIEEKAQGLDVPKEKPIVVSMIGIQRMAFFLVLRSVEKVWWMPSRLMGSRKIQILQRLLPGAKASMHKMTSGRTSNVCLMKSKIGRKISKREHMLCKKLFLGTIMCPS